MARTEWFADETFWEVLYPFLFTKGRFAAAAGEVEEIMHLAGIGSGTLLDLACGPGRHAVCFAKAGFNVTGVDLSRFLLRKAADHALLQHQSVEWVEQDMRSFVRPEAFDLALSMLSSFGYFEADEDNRKVLQNICQSLRPEGRFVLDIAGKEILARIFQPVSAESLPGVGTLFVRRAFVGDYSQIENEWTYISEEDTVKRYVMRHWVYSARELRLMLHDAGFKLVDFFGELSRKRYEPGAGRLIAVATRG